MSRHESNDQSAWENTGDSTRMMPASRVRSSDGVRSEQAPFRSFRRPGIRGNEAGVQGGSAGDDGAVLIAVRPDAEELIKDRENVRDHLRPGVSEPTER